VFAGDELWVVEFDDDAVSRFRLSA